MFARRIAQSHVAIHLVKGFIGKTVCSQKMHTKMLQPVSARPQLVLVLWQGLWEACLHYKHCTPHHHTVIMPASEYICIHLLCVCNRELWSRTASLCSLLSVLFKHSIISHNGVRRRLLLMLYKNDQMLLDICLCILNESIKFVFSLFRSVL